MKKILVIAISISIFASSLHAELPGMIRGFLGVNFTALEKAKKIGRTKIYQSSISETYKNMLKIAEAEKLTVYHEDYDEGMIVLMGFKKQLNTTMVGVFLDETEDGKTAVTLSSESTTALNTAEKIIFK